MCHGSSFVSWARTRPHLTNRQTERSSEVPRSLPVMPPTPRCSPPFCDPQQTRQGVESDEIWVHSKHSPAAKNNQDQTSLTKYQTRKENEERVQQNIKGMLLTRCSVYLDSCCTQPQMQIDLQFYISSNSGEKKETNSWMFITQNHRNVPSEFFWQSRGQF